MGPEALPAALPLIAILRGIDPERAATIGRLLHAAGIRILEVPLNSPSPFASIAALAGAELPGTLIGAGTVLRTEQVRQAHESGARLIVAPNCDPEVIECTLRLRMRSIPGFATATEAFTAIRAGAQELKLFPAISYGPQHLKALKAVLPENIPVYPVGGVGADAIRSWLDAGAAGFGFGSELFRPEYTLADIERRARRLVEALATQRLPVR
jgi:2-dehydro-3-deoxyphosphogalactonate aldolase